MKGGLNGSVLAVIRIARLASVAGEAMVVRLGCSSRNNLLADEKTQCSDYVIMRFCLILIGFQRSNRVFQSFQENVMPAQGKWMLVE